jgi:hypothetical protein
MCISPRVSSKQFHNLRHETSKINHKHSFTINKCIFSTYFTKNNQAKTLVEDPPHEKLPKYTKKCLLQEVRTTKFQPITLKRAEFQTTTCVMSES